MFESFLALGGRNRNIHFRVIDPVSLMQYKMDQTEQLDRESNLQHVTIFHLCNLWLTAALARTRSKLFV